VKFGSESGWTDADLQYWILNEEVVISCVYYRGEGGGRETAAGPPVGGSGRPPAGTALHNRRANRQHQVGDTPERRKDFDVLNSLLKLGTGFFSNEHDKYQYSTDTKSHNYMFYDIRQEKIESTGNTFKQG
jgi:hypothetical protein